MSENNSISMSFPDDPEYWKALGRFIEDYAITEAVIFKLLIFYSKVDQNRGSIIYHDTSLQKSVDLIKAITGAVSPGMDRKQELDDLFKQLKLISELRNKVVHYASFVARDNERVISNANRTFNGHKLKEYKVNVLILNAMSMDLRKICIHFVAQMVMPKSSFSDRAHANPVLNDIWQYKSF